MASHPSLQRHRTRRGDRRLPRRHLLTALDRSRGLPIGKLTRHVLAKVHLDHRVHGLNGIRACLRDGDDVALCAADREAMEQARTVIDRELAALRLRLHPINNQIRRWGDGTSLGVSCLSPGLPSSPTRSEP